MSDISKIKVSGVEYDIKDIQARKDLGNLSDLNTEAKNNLVAAINEAAQSGGGGGSTVELDTTLSETGKAADAKAVGDALAGKVDKATGKGLSSNDYTDTDKAKVDALAPVATSGSYNDLTDKPTIPTVLPNPHKLTINGTEYDGSTDVQMTIEGGGSSVPKPLTYDYMPEGYPTKSVQATTIMEEQEVAFSLMQNAIYMASLTNAFEIAVGQTYTVKWDGTEYECIGATAGENIYVLGNMSITGAGADTGEPFIYAYATAEAAGQFGTFDTSASHTISVKKIVETVTPMAEEYLPENLATKSDVEATQKVLDGVFSSVATFTFDKQTSGRDTFVFNSFDFYKISDFNPSPSDVISCKIINEAGSEYSDMNIGTNCVRYGGNFIIVASAGVCSLPVSETTTFSFTAPSAGLYAQYEAGNAIFTAETGEFTLKPSSENYIYITGLLLKSSTLGSTKKFKITVDDAGTLSATEVTA